MKSGRFRPGVGWFVLLWALAAASASGAPPDLIRIDSDPLEDLVRLESSIAPPVQILDGYALAFCPGDRIDEVRALGFEVRSLGPRRSDREYAVAYLPGYDAEADEEQLEAIGEILDRSATTAVIAYRPENRERLWQAFESVPILDRPIRFPSFDRRKVPPADTQPDLLIANLVDRVEIESLREVCQTLENYERRVSQSGECANAGHYLEDLFHSYGLTDVTTFDYSPRYFCDNIVAVQEGSRSPDEYYVIGAHYDSYSQSGSAPGADDNASGTATVMEAARLLAPYDFEATIVYIAFSGEEQGLIGSEAWAGWARSEDLDIRGMINIDMIGYLPSGYVGDLTLIVDPFDPEMQDRAFSIIPLYLPDYPIEAGSLTLGSSDHQSFWQNGFPALALHEDTQYSNPTIHTSRDRIGPSLNDFDFMRKNVQSAVALLATLARPVRVRIDHTPIEDPPSDAEGYTILASIESETPLWTDSLQVRYHVDGGPLMNEPLVATGDSTLYAATIPMQDAGSLVEYEIYARDIEGRTSHHPLNGPEKLHRFVVGLVTLYEDGFDEDLGWTVGDLDDSATSGLWVRAEPVGTGAQPEVDADSDSAGICFVTGNGPPGGEIGDADVDGGKTSLTSPRYDLEGAIRFRVGYSRWFVDETYPDDSLRVYVSNDDSENWTLLETFGTSERAWHRVEHDGVEQLLPLTDSMRLRFVAEDVGTPSLVEVAIDKVSVYAVYPRDDTPPSNSALTNAWPMPFRSDITITYHLLHDSEVVLTVYDPRGRRVAEVERGLLTVGSQQAAWDGRDSHGRDMPSGVYFVRLQIDGKDSGSLTLLKVR